MNKYWAYLLVITALSMEVVGTAICKMSNGMSNIKLAIAAYSIYAFSIYIFSVSLKYINLAVADTIWQGLGIVMITLVSFFLFKEPLNAKQVFFIIITLIGAVGLGLS